MRYTFINQEVQRIHTPVRVMCSVLNVSRSGYYDWVNRSPSAHSQADATLLTHIQHLFEAKRRRYGSPRIQQALAQMGRRHSRKRVARLMQAQRWVARPRRRRVRTTQANPNHSPAPNVLNREFQADAPNRKWVSDITYIPTDEGDLYLSVTLDLFSKRVVGWAMEQTLEVPLTEKAFDMAVMSRRPAPGLLHHSDRGSQYTALSFRQRLTDHHCIASMSRKGNCWDNAPMESFFSTLEFECLSLTPFATRAHAQQEVFAFIEIFYNRDRLHSALDFRSPAEFEALAETISPVR